MTKNIIINENDTNDQNGPFEGPEKLLEIWFASHPDSIPGESPKKGLRLVDRKTWETMLDLVNCQVLSVINGQSNDAYLLSESSLFIAPHRLILKTCGTTTLLLGLERILEIAREVAHLDHVEQVFYSRKTFMFPERQRGPHRDWHQEVDVLNKYFDNGSAYTVGKMNGDHWLLYMSSKEEAIKPPPDSSPDTTLEILMTQLHPESCKDFYSVDGESGHLAGQKLSDKLGISKLFPDISLDAFLFQPCGYSSNATWTDGDNNDRYFTIHVTPEDGISYASFETNASYKNSAQLRDLVQRVVKIFNPGKLSSTLFVGTNDEEELDFRPSNEFSNRLLDNYKRTDRINYEFSGYERE